MKEEKNNYPIVFVHGFQGWGRNEMFGHKYWGGSTDLEKELNERGIRCFTATVGPYSSNWDRACELYAFIKGGTVDYGAEHAKTHGHERYGRTFEGIYPEWGTIDPETGRVHKINIIAHSMGGQTARALIHLLEHGHSDQAEVAEASLFSGGKQWVHSLMTVSTPHNGTTLTRMVNNTLPFAQELVATIAAFKGKKQNSVYDLKLDQWGLRIKENESSRNYLTRIKESKIWNKTQDICLYDLSPEGAGQLNSWVKDSPHVYYFSWATVCTKKAPLSDKQVPHLKMRPLWYPSALFMGSHTSNKESGVTAIDSTWWPNDGVVNSVSMKGPSTSIVVEVQPNSLFKPGQWNYLGALNKCDHMDVIGAMKISGAFPVDGYDSITHWYAEQAERLLGTGY